MRSQTGLNRIQHSRSGDAEIIRLPCDARSVPWALGRRTQTCSPDGGCMKRVTLSLLFFTAVLFVPSPLHAQSATTGAIAGIVRDATGAVLPGVTVEAASPALIEKVRSAVTDSSGNYKIVDLRPGTYSVTF